MVSCIQKSLLKSFSFICFLSACNYNSLAQGDYHGFYLEQPNGHVRTLYTDTVENYLILGGSFSFIGNETRRGVSRWDGFQFAEMDCGIGRCGTNVCPSVAAFAKNRFGFYMLAFSDSIGCERINYVAKWNSIEWENIGFESYLDGTSFFPYYFSIVDDILFVAGRFDSIQGRQAQGLAIWDGLRWDTSFIDPYRSFDNVGFGECVRYRNDLICHNILQDTAGGILVIALWNGNHWVSVGGAFSNRANSISSVLVFKDELYVAGGFNRNLDPEAPGNSIARWNGERWDDLNGGVFLNNNFYPGLVHDMGVYNDNLYVVGEFGHAGTLPANDIAIWDGSQWCTSVGSIEGYVSSASIFHDSLFIGGGFLRIGGDSMPYLAKCKLDQVSDTCETVIGVPENIAATSFTVFPNPTDQEISILRPHVAVQDQQIDLYDFLGRHLFSFIFHRSHQKVNLDISDLSPGIYFIYGNETGAKTRVVKY